MLNRFEKVSIAESKQNEWWLVRKSPIDLQNNVVCNADEIKEESAKSYNPIEANKSHNSEISLGSSYSMISHKSKRISDVSLSKSLGKRISNESDMKNETKSSCNTNKSILGSKQVYLLFFLDFIYYLAYLIYLPCISKNLSTKRDSTVKCWPPYIFYAGQIH